MKTFKKGETVYRLKTWDNKGTFSIEKCVVDSAGKKQIHLEGSKGEMRKHREYTEQIGKEVGSTHLIKAAFVSKSDVELEALALADALIVNSIAYMQIKIRDAIDRHGFDSYNRYMQKSLQEFHTPDFKWI